VSSPEDLFSDPVAQTNVRAAFNGVDYVVAWQEGQDLRFARLTNNGERLDGNGKTVAHGSLRLFDIAAGNGITLVVWNEDSASGDTGKLHVTRIDASGAVLDTAPPQLDTCYVRRAHALWNGSEFVVFWSCTATVAVRIRPDGILIDAVPKQVFPTDLYFEVASNKNRYQLAYATSSGGINVVAVSSELQLATGSAQLNLTTETLTSFSSFSIDSNGDDFLVVWSNDANEIVGQRTSWNADPIGPRVVFSGDAAIKGKPQASFDGSVFVVTWPEVQGSRVAFIARQTDGEIAQIVGPPFIVATAPVINVGLTLPLLSQWSYAPAPVPAIAYSRFDQPNGLTWFRAFLDVESSQRRRVVTP
jgi:hypothetical protein